MRRTRTSDGRRSLWRPFALVVLGTCFALGSPAWAQGELAVRWSNCAPSGPNTVDPTAFCQSDFGVRRLVLSFAPGADVTQVVGWTLVLDMISNASPFPPWWQVQPGGCRYTYPNQFLAGLPSGFEDCIDPWSATGSALVQSLIYPRPGGDGRQFRVIMGVGVPAPQAFTLVRGETYLAGILSIGFARTVSGECPGCTEPVCFVFNSAEVLRTPGAEGDPPLLFETPSSAYGNWATSGSAIACEVVPARARTWGQIKAMYR